MENTHRKRWYVPRIERFLVAVLYHEARVRGVRMTVLVNSLLREALKSSRGWRLAEEEHGAPPERSSN